MLPSMSTAKRKPKPSTLHPSEREEAIVKLLAARAFVSFSDVDEALEASEASIRRDFVRAEEGAWAASMAVRASPRQKPAPCSRVSRSKSTQA
jgi:hypothetical protein